ncbi:phosphate starvation-inducible protein PhoH [Oceanidesulfovibrio indonesiensis]|uniref:Phosphate starvation-inducible protein PhoH n=1 Tax=Oceanidesulfovibrio indonesiensis TaxID=54767 RepID=A0A7M3MDF2_9BACT|nr:PhoH family protein [Oceanidesulfovibrio indonesiensis]TVM16261.1 phosphate starvation-inducible protein PhoH [Oceanidesulfovibrio indonesiensis]
MTKKNYVLDTNVLIENPQAIVNLKNGNENNIFIPYHVLIELNQLKTNQRIRHIVAKVVDVLLEHRDSIQFIQNDASISRFTEEIVDNYILKEIKSTSIEDPILVTNDRILQLQAGLAHIKSEEFRDSKPFESESQLYTGFMPEGEAPLTNSFTWVDGKPVFHGANSAECINYTVSMWNVKPRSVYQNLALMLMQNPTIDIVSMQSEAGFGKTFLALATSLYLVLEKRLYEKIYIVKPTIELGSKLGYLPGDIKEKMEPYVKYIHDLLLKLHEQRPANKLFLNPNDDLLRYNTKKFEILPLNYIRGMNIENAVVIVDETQNLSRNEVRALLTRMGEGVKCFCLGDTSQVDNPYLSESNNGLNWIVRKFKGFSNYAHIVLKGDRSRGPITDLVLKSKL